MLEDSLTTLHTNYPTHHKAKTLGQHDTQALASVLADARKLSCSYRRISQKTTGRGMANSRERQREAKVGKGGKGGKNRQRSAEPPNARFCPQCHPLPPNATLCLIPANAIPRPCNTLPSPPAKKPRLFY